MKQKGNATIVLQVLFWKVSVQIIFIHEHLSWSHLPVLNLFNPFNPKIKIWILMLPLFTSNRGSGEKMIAYQANSFCVIVSIIFSWPLCFTKALILQGEIWCWSLLGFKGLSTCLSQQDIHVHCTAVIHFKGLLIRFQVTSDVKFVGRELNKNH